MRVIVDLSKCCGAGRCVMTAPQVFDQQEDGTVKLLDETPPVELHAVVREAAKVCPGFAIRVEERE
jgi:ferredoxin